MENRREHVRTSMKVPLRIDHPRHGGLMATTRDISDGGVFVVLDGAQRLLRLGELVCGQVQGLPGEAPLVRMRVVRCESSGAALTYAGD
ncbi:PilZ domain-containing protein [Pseudomonas stutzeri]|nr:PilZ domain-containing protein [Stutzerimonas stutzeri]